MAVYCLAAAADWRAAVPSWIDLLDILAVAFLLYVFLSIIKDTRAFPLLITLALLLAVYYGTDWVQLNALRWLLTNLLPYLIFALIVIYAGEIRRGLTRLGWGLPLLGELARSDATEPVDDVVLAASYFAQHRTGALIVFEREISLSTYTESGIALQAAVSYDLLVSIFLPTAPLHDGAVIIRKNRIVAASCFLPLSLNPLLSTQMGTRHRAAIGVTEESDAVAVVVSEETGAIALMNAGSVELHLTPEQLRDRLRRHLRPRPGVLLGRSAG